MSGRAVLAALRKGVSILQLSRITDISKTVIEHRKKRKNRPTVFPLSSCLL